MNEDLVQGALLEASAEIKLANLELRLEARYAQA